MARVFDVNREAIVLTMQDGVITSRSIENIETPMVSLKFERLTGLGIQSQLQPSAAPNVASHSGMGGGGR